MIEKSIYHCDKKGGEEVVEFDEVVREIMDECDVLAVTVYKEGVETGGIAILTVHTGESSGDGLSEINSKYSKVNLHGNVCGLHIDRGLYGVDALGEILVYIEDISPSIPVEDGRRLNKSSVSVEEGLKRVQEVAESTEEVPEQGGDTHE
jgi:hypothetical protein